MSVAAGPLTRALVSGLSALRAFSTRTPVASLIALALAGAAALIAFRRARPRRRSGARERDASSRPRALAGVRRITIGVDVGSVGGSDSSSEGPVFERANDGALVVQQAALPYLMRFAKMCDLYLISRVSDDSGEAEVRSSLQAAGIFEAGMDARKVLFVETSNGRVSVVRQLEPHLHIDGRFDIVLALQRFIKFVAFVAPGAAARSDAPTTASNMFMYDTFESFWTPPGQRPAQVQTARAS